MLKPMILSAAILTAIGLDCADKQSAEMADKAGVPAVSVGAPPNGRTG